MEKDILVANRQISDLVKKLNEAQREFELKQSELHRQQQQTLS